MKKNKSKSCPYSSNYSRQKFLKILGKGAVMAMSVPFIHSLTGCDGGDGETPEKVQITKPGALSGTAPVSIVRKNTIKEGVYIYQRV